MRLMILGLVGLLSACGPAPSSKTGERSPAAAVAPPASEAVADRSMTASAALAAEASCSAEIGEEAARKLVERCIAVSPATHPPCNVANSCAMIRGEIERSCALFAADDPLPADLCPPRAAPAVTRHETPVSLVRDYYSAIAARDYARAYSLWRDEGRASGKSLAAFAGGFAETASVEVEPGAPSAPEGAAGSTYVTVPVTVRATTRDGARQRFTGEYVLRRVNDVPGATPSQLDWRIYSASLKPAP